jgi:hypothetical protein
MMICIVTRSLLNSVTSNSGNQEALESTEKWKNPGLQKVNIEVIKYAMKKQMKNSQKKYTCWQHREIPGSLK